MIADGSVDLQRSVQNAMDERVASGAEIGLQVAVVHASLLESGISIGPHRGPGLALR